MTKSFNQDISLIFINSCKAFHKIFFYYSFWSNRSCVRNRFFLIRWHSIAVTWLWINFECNFERNKSLHSFIFFILFRSSFQSLKANRFRIDWWPLNAPFALTIEAFVFGHMARGTANYIHLNRHYKPSKLFEYFRYLKLIYHLLRRSDN